MEEEDSRNKEGDSWALLSLKTPDWSSLWSCNPSSPRAKAWPTLPNPASPTQAHPTAQIQTQRAETCPWPHIPAQLQHSSAKAWSFGTLPNVLIGSRYLWAVLKKGRSEGPSLPPGSLKTLSGLSSIRPSCFCRTRVPGTASSAGTSRCQTISWATD